MGPEGQKYVDDCCCFVASVSGLEPRDIEELRDLRAALNVFFAFKKIVSDTYPSWGPPVANYLRSHPDARAVMKKGLEASAEAWRNLSPKQGPREKSQLREQEKDWQLISSRSR